MSEARATPRLIPTPLECVRCPGVINLPASIAYRGPHAPLARRILAPALEDSGINWLDEPRAGSALIEHQRSASEAPGYSLDITPSDRPILALRGTSIEDVRHALVTLAQLIRQYGRDLPCLRITDRPMIPLRGVMLDISRDKVPTMASLRAFVDQMESLKLNHLQLYTEHTFAYAGHEEVWRDSSPMTPAETRELDAYARERGVELAANQNCLGHLHRWMKLPRYAPLSEIPPEVPQWTFETDDGRAFTKTGPHSLCPTDPRSIALIEDLLDQLLLNFSSPLVNIGCDEAFDVGQGRSREAVAQRGRAAVYFDWLRAVDAIVKRHGKRSMFWADIALRHPDHLHRIPEGAIPLVWGYEADAPFSDALTRFPSSSPAHPITPSPHQSPTSPALQQGVPPIFCPGTSSWLTINGRTSTRRANIDSAARCAAAASSGLLVCDWGDRGHRQHWPIALHSIAYAAQQAWTGHDPQRRFDASAAAAYLFGAGAAELGPWLDELGDIDASLRRHLRNTSALFVELHRPLRELPSDPSCHGTLHDWQSIRGRLESMRTRLADIAPTSLDALVRLELEHTLNLAVHAAEKAIVTRACLDEPNHLPRGTALIRLAADLAALTEEHRELWPRRNRPGGLIDSAAHYEKIIDDYERPSSES